MYTQYCPVCQTKMSANVHYVQVCETYCSPNIPRKYGMYSTMYCTVYNHSIVMIQFKSIKHKHALITLTSQTFLAGP